MIFIWKNKGPEIAKTFLKKKIKGLAPPDIKICKAIVIMTVS